MLPSFSRMHLKVRAPAHDALSTATQPGEAGQEARLLRRSSSSSLLRRNPWANALKLDQRAELVPVAPATMQPLIDHFVTQRFLQQWNTEDLANRHWVLQKQLEIPAVDELGFEDAPLECDIVCLNAQTHAAALVVCTLHTQRNFMNALGEVLRHGHYYGVLRTRTTGDMMGIIALDRKPRVHEKQMAEARGVQCWWPKRSIAECLGEASPDAGAEKENASPFL